MALDASLSIGVDEEDGDVIAAEAAVCKDGVNAGAATTVADVEAPFIGVKTQRPCDGADDTDDDDDEDDDDGGDDVDANAVPVLV